MHGCNPSSFKLRQEDGRFKAYLDYTASPTLPSQIPHPENKKTNPSNFRKYRAPQAELSLTRTHWRFSSIGTDLPRSLTLIWTLYFRAVTEDIFSSYYLLKKDTVIYADTNFYYLVKIKFCKITSFSVSFG